MAGILVFVEQRSGGIRPASQQAISEARRLGAGPVSAVLAGSGMGPRDPSRARSDNHPETGGIGRVPLDGGLWSHLRHHRSPCPGGCGQMLDEIVQRCLQDIFMPCHEDILRAG